MKDSWSDFEKYVFERLEQNHAEHAEIKTKVAVLEERVKPRKSKAVTWKIGLGALLVAFVAAVKEALK